MSINFLDSFYIKKYKELLKEIENLNKKNVKGYNSFFEYVLADKKMINYFNELKKIERKCNKIHVDTYEVFEKNVFKQLKKIYENKLIEIFEIKNNDEKILRLREFKKELRKCLGYDVDKCITYLIEDIDEKLKDFDQYMIMEKESISNNVIEQNLFKQEEEIKHNSVYNKDIIKQIEKNLYQNEQIIEEDDDEDDPFLNEAIESVIEIGQASTSFIQRRFKVGYARAGRIIDQLEARGIISGYEGSKPRRVLMTIKRWEELKEFYPTGIKNKKIIKEDNKETVNSLNDEENTTFKMDYEYDNEYNNEYNILEKIHNCLIVENILDSDKTNFIDTILKYNSPEKLKLILIGLNNLEFNFYNGKYHLLIPTITDIRRASGTLAWILQEINNRLEMFVKVKAKDINSYNEKVTSNLLPEIIVIIDEIYEMLNGYENKEYLLRILLNCERVGIKIIMYSKFSKRNLNIGPIEDLLQIYQKNTPNLLLRQTYCKEDEIKKIDGDMNGFDFEKYAGELLSRNGFEKIEITQQSRDFGVDIVAYKDDVKYSIQCKKYSSTVGIKAVQEVIASKTINNSHVAVVITNNYFTSSAKELASKNNVLLWDRDKLIELIDKMK